MCPQRLFTNTELFMNAGKRNPTRARSGPDLAGGAGAGAPRGGRLFFRSVRDRAAVRPGRGAARRGRSVRLGLQPRRLCLGAEGLRPRPCGAWMDLAPPAFPGLRGALSSPPRPHSAFLSSTLAQGKLCVKDIHFGSCGFRQKAARIQNSESPTNH